ncbi:MAG TPA: thioredoxin family protein [Brumimicrobium sp.]|nr:thioredoxin family protein [Brumimicrobium sp.]
MIDTTTNIISWEEYLDMFDQIINADSPAAPYDNPDYFQYTKLNNSRMLRWLKTGTITEETATVINNIKEPQTWYLILEPWCGDAAHLTPFIQKMAALNANIDLKIVLRDTEPFMIDDYLTNGGKSIPKLVIRDADGKDLHVWGPRPVKAQELYLQLKEANKDLEEQKLELQKWYNKDKGEEIQKEFRDILG